MPQPYLPTFSKKRYSVGFEAIKERPAIAEIIGRCISIWSYVDNEIGGLFGILLGTDSETAYRVFAVLRRWANQQEALNAAAGSRLAGDEMTLFRALITVYTSLESQRNELAHGCFGICPDDDSLLFVIKIQHHVSWQADILPKHLKRLIPVDSHQGLKERMYVYRLSELEALYNRMEKLWFDIFYFNGYLRDPTNNLRQAEFNNVLAARGKGA